ncbi:MAG: hypothetical protein JJ895_15540 [Balneolaceae bacterium]|nr:hypothetical protein [Balneolaceae bacterium]
MKSNTYDIIIAGAGLSGLSLAWYLTEGNYQGNVLVVDNSFAPYNSKTWCFWADEKPFFSEIVYKKWRKTYFSALDFTSFLYMTNYGYYCIRENDFKEYVLTQLRKKSNVTLLEEGILDIYGSKKKGVLVTKNSETFVADYIFQSIIVPDSAKKEQLKYPLLQHFFGMEIETADGTFDVNTFTIMDVDESFDDGYAFMYVLPFDHNRALIEYTIFSEQVLKKKEYKKKIRKYISDKYGFEKKEYKVGRTEFGAIPMDDRPFEPQLDKNIYNLGTVGGLTKASTGYTFTRVQRYSQLLAQSLIEGASPLAVNPSKARYRYYDKLLLHILSSSVKDSHRVFMHLFKNNSIDDLFSFLNEDGSIADDLKIMNSVPYLPFFKAIANNLK